MNGHRLKVANVITKLDIGGAQETVIRTCAGLDPDRFDVTLIGGVEFGRGGESVSWARELGLRVLTEPTLVRRPSPLADSRAMVRLVQLFRRERFDVVHTHTSKAGVIGRAAARVARVPHVVHTVHGWNFHGAQRSGEFHAYRLIERALAPITSRLIVVGDGDRNAGLAAGVGRADQYVTIRSGIDVDTFRRGAARRARTRAELGLPGEVPVVGSVGRLAEQKDPLALLDAFAKVHASIPQAHLLLIGDGPLRGAVEDAVARHALNGSVQLLGVRTDVDRLLGACDVLALASRWEGLPRVVIEAMAAGVAVIATDVGSVRDVLADRVTGRLVSPGDVDGLALAIERLFADPGERERLIANAAERVFEFSVEKMVGDMARLYRELAGP